jgi:hypothetical protein
MKAKYEKGEELYIASRKRGEVTLRLPQAGNSAFVFPCNEAKIITLASRLREYLSAEDHLRPYKTDDIV